MSYIILANIYILFEIVNKLTIIAYIIIFYPNIILKYIHKENI